MPTKTEKRPTSGASSPAFILLAMDEKWREQLGKKRVVLCRNEEDIRRVLLNAHKKSLWISDRSEMTDQLLRAMSHTISRQRGASRCVGDLLMLKPPRPMTIPILSGSFGNVIGEAPSFKSLPEDQLREVLSSSEEEVRDVFIGGGVDTRSGLLTLVRGNRSRVTVPLSIFRPSGTSKPNFRRFGLDDYGHTVRFGQYEASAHFVLSEADADYRRRANAKRRARAKGFGPSLRRLRIQQRLSRDDFPGVTAKTIARLERSEVGKPRGTTLKSILKTLQVDSQELATY